MITAARILTWIAIGIFLLCAAASLYHAYSGDRRPDPGQKISFP